MGRAGRNRVTLSLRAKHQGRLNVQSKSYQCSEITRLVGCWVLDEYPEYKVHVCKGEISGGSVHDILVIDDGETLSLIDPTIWQIFSESNSIFIGFVSNMQEALNLLHEKYSGSWKVSEDLCECDDNYQKKLLAIIKNNK